MKFQIASVDEQIRQMGKADAERGVTECPFGERSDAAKLWKEGAREDVIEPYYEDNMLRLFNGSALNVLRTLPDGSVNCGVTSPPYYGLRDYKVDGQIGLEETPEEYVAKLVDVFREVRRVLKDDGTLWVNIGDSYAGSGPSGARYQSKTTKEREGKTTDGAFRISKSLIERGLTYAEKKPIPPPGLKSKDLIGIPWMLAFALRADGWYLRQDIIWAKPNPMPESVTDRCTKAHEYIFMLSKSARYYYDQDAIKEPAIYGDDDRKGRALEAHKRNPTASVNGIRPRSDKQRGHSRRHAGFNKRWDAMEKAEQCSGMRNKRSVWTVATKPYAEAHFATYPPELIRPCILAGCPVGGVVLDPFAGSGITALVANELGRKAVLIELNKDYCDLAMKRNRQKVIWEATA